MAEKLLTMCSLRWSHKNKGKLKMFLNVYCINIHNSCWCRWVSALWSFTYNTVHSGAFTRDRYDRFPSASPHNPANKRNLLIGHGLMSWGSRHLVTCYNGDVLDGLNVSRICRKGRKAMGIYCCHGKQMIRLSVVFDTGSMMSRVRVIKRMLNGL